MNRVIGSRHGMLAVAKLRWSSNVHFFSRGLACRNLFSFWILCLSRDLTYVALPLPRHKLIRERQIPVFMVFKVNRRNFVAGST